MTTTTTTRQVPAKMAARRRQCTGYVQSDGHMNLAMRWTTKQNLVSHVGICVVSYVTIVPLEAGGAKRAPGCCWHQDSHACSVCRALAKHNEGSHFLAYILLIIMGALYADHRCLDGRARDQVSPSSAPFILANINPMSPPALESRSPRLANIFSTSLTQPSPFSHSCPPSPRGRGPYVLRRVGGDAHGAAVLFGVGVSEGGWEQGANMRVMAVAGPKTYRPTSGVPWRCRLFPWGILGLASFSGGRGRHAFLFPASLVSWLVPCGD